ncbi:hypothetical protein, partial [uncultured Methanobrevibacter sp.]|uniref:hypothetical protein n=1 Tax=uncultured Methanobrevibacter sp. TaxID=253161 RepID=UPI0025F710F1
INIIFIIIINKYIKYIDYYDHSPEDYSNRKYVLKNNKIIGSTTKRKITNVKNGIKLEHYIS